jgi:hypothetical protein
MEFPFSSTQKLRKAILSGAILGLSSLAHLSEESLAATRPIRPGGSTPPPTVVNPNPPPRPSQMVAGRNAGNMVLSTPTSRTSSVPAAGGTPQVNITSDP